MSKALFTSEMGRRLSQLRRESGLSQDQVAERMGRTGKWRKTVISRLEQGKFVNPSLGLIARYLRAVGARWNRFADLLEQAGVLPGEERLTPASGAGTAAGIEISDNANAEACRYQRLLPYRRSAAPVHPAQTRKAAERLRAYRIVAHLIDHATRQVLAASDAKLAQYPNYLAVGRQSLSLFWRSMKSVRRRPGFVEILTPTSPCIANLPVQIHEQLLRKSQDWQQQGLDIAVVHQVQQAALEHFVQAAQEQPSLLPEVRTRRKTKSTPQVSATEANGRQLPEKN